MKLFYMDCETTGLDCVQNGVIQIAGIIEIDGEVLEEFSFFCRPFKGDLVDKSALDVNGTSLDDLKRLDRPEDVYIKFKAILGKYVDKYDRKDKFYPVGQNVGFDIDFLREWFKKNGDMYFGSYVHYHKIDLIAITTIMKIAGKIDLENMKLETVMKALDLGIQTHTALDDVRAVRKIFYKYLSWIKVSGN